MIRLVEGAERQKTPNEIVVCTENSILIDYVIESPNVSGEGVGGQGFRFKGPWGPAAT
jgi:hypothetical protein